MSTHPRTSSVTVRCVAVPPTAPDPMRSRTAADIAHVLRLVLPKVLVAIWAAPLAEAFRVYDLTSARRIAAALGQFAVEAGEDFGAVAENLCYTSAQRVCSVYPNHFGAPDEAIPYLSCPDRLANRVYANYRGNGDEASGDGYRFRGRGLIQLTGRDLYARFGATPGMSAEAAAGYCETPAGAAASGCWYLAANGCLEFADRWELACITRAVNGRAMLGHARRVAIAEKALDALLAA